MHFQNQQEHKDHRFEQRVENKMALTAEEHLLMWIVALFWVIRSWSQFLLKYFVINLIANFRARDWPPEITKTLLPEHITYVHSSKAIHMVSNDDFSDRSSQPDQVTAQYDNHDLTRRYCQDHDLLKLSSDVIMQLSQNWSNNH